MKAALHSITLFVCVLLPLFGCKKTKSDTQPLRPATLLEGEYLSTDYVEELKKTRSPLKAGSSERIDLIVVRRTDDGLQLSPVFNFHEGGYQFKIKSNGSVSPVDNGGDEVANLTATVLDDHTFRFGYASFSPANYVFVRNASEHVSKVLFVGKYIDGYDRRYEFRQDGWAIFPDHKFRFEVGLDHIGCDFDHFSEKGGNNDVKTWAFRSSRDTLEIFTPTEAQDCAEDISDRRPPISLRRMQ